MRPQAKPISLPLLLAGLLVAGGLLPAAGCVVVRDRARPYPVTASAGCHPSQYWDGTQCRHKGKGHGARKHDGHGKGKKK